MKMREILFRAWIPKDNDKPDGEYVMTYGLCFEDCEPINDQLADVKNLMQYTGLKDHNGKMIFEGDIVKYGHNKFCIEFKCGSWHTQNERGSWLLYPICQDAEIIGNVFENPELMWRGYEQ